MPPPTNITASPLSLLLCHHSHHHCTTTTTITASPSSLYHHRHNHHHHHHRHCIIITTIAASPSLHCRCHHHCTTTVTAIIAATDAVRAVLNTFHPNEPALGSALKKWCHLLETSPDDILKAKVGSMAREAWAVGSSAEHHVSSLRFGKKPNEEEARMPVPTPECLQRAPSWRFAYHAPCWCLDPRNKSLVPPPSPDWNKPVPRGLHVGGTSYPGGFLYSLKERRQSGAKASSSGPGSAILE